jgi:oligopeptide transport system substrate-binding protein
VTEPPFEEARRRQGLSMALDRDIVTRQVTGAGELPAFAFVPPGVANAGPYDYAWRAWSPEQRRAEAKRLYAEAGFGPENPLRTEIRYNTDDNHRRIAVAVAAMWKDVLGVETSLLNEEWKVLLQNRSNPALWEVMRFGWVGDYNDPYTFLEIFHSNHGQNFTGFAEPEYDRLIEAAAVEYDAAARTELMNRAERILLAQYPILPLYFTVGKHLVKPHVRGFEANIMDHNYSRHYRIERR